MKKITAVIFIFSLILSSFTTFNKERLNEHSFISMELKEFKRFEPFCPNADRIYIHEGRIYLNLNADEMQLLKKTELKFEPAYLPTDGHALAATGDINGLFHNYNETTAFLNDLHNRFPELTELGSAGLSLEGRNLNYIKISNPSVMQTSKPNIYIIGCHHAREWISVEVPLFFARYLLENYGSDPQAARIINGSTIYILPLMNPDGLEYSIHYYRMWRKNRRDNNYYSSYGVDINRNYGAFWGYDNSGSSPNPWSEIYRGVAPFSEPETAALRDLLQSNPPAGLISYHSYSQAILYAWNYINNTTPDNEEMKEIAETMSDLIFQVNGRAYVYGCGADALYTTNGDTVDYVYATYGAPTYTIELPPVDFISGGFITSENDINSVFNENLPALLYFANYFIK
jgi:carboxypeptidase T